MIPNTGISREENIEIIREPVSTYRWDMEKSRISGYIDGIEAMKQAVYKILHTERYVYEIYSWNYGIELSDLIGKSKAYVYPELKRRIAEALTQDDRIQRVDDFSFAAQEEEVVVTFVAYTDLGEVEAERKVRI